MSALPPTLTLHGSKSSPPGRSLHVTQSFLPGQTIATFSGLGIAIPTSPHLSQSCSHCLRLAVPGSQITAVRACTACRTTHYCSVRCQKADWALVHRDECKAFKRVRSSGHDASLLPTPVRALMQVLLREDVRRAVESLEGHVEAFRGRPDEWRDLELQAMGALHYLGRKQDARAVSEAIGILCQLRVNSFTRGDEEADYTGLYVNPGLAMVNHSCVPNAFVQLVGRAAILRASQAVEEGEEVRISYIDNSLHRSQRLHALKDRYHFDCLCQRCSSDLDVYQVAKAYPHLELNRLSLVPDLDSFRNPPIKVAFHKEQPLQRVVEEIYPKCSIPLSKFSEQDDPRQILRQRWELCEPLRRAKLYAIEPLPQVLVDVCNYFSQQGDFARSLAIACFLALNSDPYRFPMPFAARRVNQTLMMARLLSNTAEDAASIRPNSNVSHSSGLRLCLSKTDQVTLAQGVLTIAVRFGTAALSEESQDVQQAREQLQEIQSLTGREKESALIQAWAKDQDDMEGRLFFEHAILKPIQELSEFALPIMDSELEAEQSVALVRSQ